MKSKIDYTLYLVTDRSIMSTKTIEIAVEDAIKGGCTIVQLREKAVSSLEFLEIAIKLKRITSKYNVPLIINDRVDIALAVDAEGVHVGQQDLPAEIARKLIGENKILGVSVANFKEAITAYNNGADYLGVGAMFATNTKSDANITTFEELKKIRNEILIPIVVIGGINADTIPLFHGSGINGVAVVSAIISQPNIFQASQNLRMLLYSQLYMK